MMLVTDNVRKDVFKIRLNVFFHRLRSRREMADYRNSSSNTAAWKNHVETVVGKDVLDLFITSSLYNIDRHVIPD